MNNAFEFIGDIFTAAPACFLAWPAAGMLAGTLLAMVSSKAGARLAVTPRALGGLIGVMTGPFVHANWAHFSANLPPFLVLGWLVLRGDEAAFPEIALAIAGAQGALLWVCGRRAAHLGMSGVIFGFFGWLLAVAWFTRATPDLLIAAGVLIFYGGMLAGVAPARDGTSWEGHLFGLVAGGAVAWYYLGS